MPYEYDGETNNVILLQNSKLIYVPRSNNLLLIFLAIFQIIQSIRMGIWALHLHNAAMRSETIRHSSKENWRLQFWSSAVC